MKLRLSILFFYLTIASSCLLKKKSPIESIPSANSTITCPLHYHKLEDSCRLGANYGQIQTFEYGYKNYLHPGIDILGKPGQEVYSVSDGVIKYISTPDDLSQYPCMCRVAITKGIDAKEKIGYLYAHIQKETIPFHVGDTIKAGEYLGKICEWFNPEYTHLHFSEIINPSGQWEGKWLTIQNQNIIRHGMQDTTKPVFINVYKNLPFGFISENGNILSSDSLSGRIQVIFNCYDYSNSINKVSVSEIAYQLFDSNNNICKKCTYKMDMAIDVYEQNYYTQRIAPILYSVKKPFTSKDNGNKKENKFYYCLIINKIENLNFLEIGDTYLDTRKYKNGDYVLKIIAKDYFNNEQFKTLKIKIIN